MVAESVRGVEEMGPAFLYKRGPLLIPEPGQRVRLRAGRGPWRGNFRAVSEPYTDEAREVVIRVSTESEYQNAIREGRRAVGMPWPARLIEVVFSPLEEERPQELPQGLQEKPERAEQQPRPGAQEEAREDSERPQERRGWWQRMFGG